jgi:glycosyltransferase involved in cell wall biosynthesis
MKVLISAYSCEPGKGSEREVGWNVVREAAKHHQVWVLTRPDESKAAIEAELARHPITNLKFVYFTLPFWQDSLRWGQSGAMQIHYYLWQIQAYFVARRLHRDIQFDLAHHVTFVKYSTPSFLSLLPIPFIFGPVGGGESTPKGFEQDFSRQAKRYEWARSAIRWIGEQDPFVRLTVRRSQVVRATTDDTAQRLYQLGAAQVQVAPAIGLLPEQIRHLAQYSLPESDTLPGSDQTPIRFISIGRLLHWKGFHLGLKAFAQAGLRNADYNAEYWIVGDGPELEALKSQVSQDKIASQVKFWGQLPRLETLEKLGQCHTLVHPSLHDSGGGVCLEAMAAGRPVICLDLGGPAIQVTEQTGFKVAAQDRQQAIRDIAIAMQTLANDPALRKQMGEAGRQVAHENFSWTVVGERLDALYQTAVADALPVVK